MPCRLAKRNHFIYAGTLVNRVFRRRCACKCSTGGGAITSGIGGRYGVLICPRQNSGLRNRNMSVTDIVIDTGGVVRIVDRDLHLNILMRLHDSLKGDGVIQTANSRSQRWFGGRLCINSQLNCCVSF